MRPWRVCIKTKYVVIGRFFVFYFQWRPAVENPGLTCSWHIKMTLDGSWHLSKENLLQRLLERYLFHSLGISLFLSFTQLLNSLCISWVAFISWRKAIILVCMVLKVQLWTGYLRCRFCGAVCRRSKTCLWGYHTFTISREEDLCTKTSKGAYQGIHNNTFLLSDKYIILMTF